MQCTDPCDHDYVLVFHTGLLLIQQCDSTGQWVLPQAHGLSGQKLAATYHDLLHTPADLSEPTTVAGRAVDTIVIPAMALPHLHDDERWVTPEETGSIDWAPGWAEIIAEIRPRLLAGLPLADEPGSVAVRVGSSVRRYTGPWTPAVHAGLNHLANFGLDATPKVLGVDELDREMLSYLPGRLVPADQFLNDVQLAETASWLLRLHEALRDFNHPGPFRTPTPQGATMCGHNQISQRNLCFAGNRLVGVVNWDHLGPTTAPLELAWFVWSAAPLGGVLKPKAVAPRALLIAQTYDLELDVILQAVPQRITQHVATITAEATAGDDIAQQVVQSGQLDQLTQRLQHFNDQEHAALLDLIT